MKTYKAYKESNNKAIGLIPSDWSITSIKNILEIPITDGPHTTPEFYDEGIPFLSAEAVKGGKLDFNRKRGFISEEDFELFSQKYIPARGDIFMIKSGATTGNTAMVETDEIFTIWSPLAVFRANEQKVVPKFLHFYLMSPNFKSLVELSWSYGTQQNIGMGVLSNLSIPYPNTEIQTQIANYLDHKTQIIDALIEKKEQLIKKLQAQRQAIINEAVTKGLNPNAEMKDSGIEWLGEVPAHWDATVFRRICDLQQGLQIAISERYHEPIEGALEYITTKSIHNPNDFRQYVLNPKNSVVCHEDEILLGRTGNTGEVVSGVKGVFHNNFFKIDFDVEKADKDFLIYYLKSTIVQELIMLVAGTTTIPDLNHGDFLNLPLVFPEKKEQIEIAEFIAINFERINNLISKIKTQSKKLKEYRQSIISEAVTGKIDVRDWQVKIKQS